MWKNSKANVRYDRRRKARRCATAASAKKASSTIMLSDFSIFMLYVLSNIRSLERRDYLVHPRQPPDNE